MTLRPQSAKDIYAGPVARRYELSMSHIFTRFKQWAFDQSSLKKGDRVLVFCCGTGLDFTPLIDKIGSSAEIVGVDFSSQMLSQAQRKIEHFHWDNIKLIQADVSLPISELAGERFDAAVCTLGLSIIPEYQAAFDQLRSLVKPGGELIIGDMQLASGRWAYFNPLTLWLSKRYGGTKQGHKNTLTLRAQMQQELAHVRTQSYFFGAYFYCIGQTIP